MSTERDELHRIIDDRVDMLGSGVRNHEVWDAADAILAAGYRKPRVVTTAEEVRALPFQSVIVDASGSPFINDGDIAEQWCTVTRKASPRWLGSADIELPATVLHAGGR